MEGSIDDPSLMPVIPDDHNYTQNAVSDDALEIQVEIHEIPEKYKNKNFVERKRHLYIRKCNYMYFVTNEGL